MVNSYNDGKQFERKVEAWAKKRFSAAKTAMRHFVNGLTVTKPYEVDVWVNVSGKYLKFFGEDTDIWIECKSRKASIKRKDVLYLTSKARDVYEAVSQGRERLYFNRLMIVSTSRFDFDAIALADQQGVSCYHYNGKSYSHINDYDCDQEPKWLTDISS